MKPQNSLHLAVGRALVLDIAKYGSQGWSGGVPGIALLVPTQLPTVPHHPGYTPALHPGHGSTGVRCTVHVRGLNMAVGLRSVDQLTLRSHFSRLRGMTEVYNLVRIDNR